MASTEDKDSEQVGSSSELLGSITEASRLTRTEGIVSELIGTKWVNDGLKAKSEEEGADEVIWVGMTGEEEEVASGWVR